MQNINNNYQPFRVKAHVLVPVFHMYNFNMTIEGWTVIPTSGGTQFIKEFHENSNRKDWMESVTNLRYILLSCFLDDFAPRIISRLVDLN